MKKFVATAMLGVMLTLSACGHTAKTTSNVTQTTDNNGNVTVTNVTENSQ